MQRSNRQSVYDGVDDIFQRTVECASIHRRRPISVVWTNSTGSTLSEKIAFRLFVSKVKYSLFELCWICRFAHTDWKELSGQQMEKVRKTSRRYFVERFGNLSPG